MHTTDGAPESTAAACYAQRGNACAAMHAPKSLGAKTPQGAPGGGPREQAGTRKAPFLDRSHTSTCAEAVSTQAHGASLTPQRRTQGACNLFTHVIQSFCTRRWWW